MKKLCILLAALIHIYVAQSQDRVTVKEYQKTFSTYPFSDPSPIPLLTQVYPYFRYDGFTDNAVNKEWKVVEIENAYIKILILPEIGGKIWAAIDKKTDSPFLYYNHVVKFRDIAMRGPWTSGGLESNFGIIGHTPNCATPVDYIIQHKEDGSISCTIGALDLLTRSNWRVEINVPNNKAFFTTQAFWYNTTSLEQPYYHWMNAGAKASNDLEFIFPGNKYLGHNGEYASWPKNEQNGKKISWYKENDFGGYKSYHVFGKYTNFFGTYYHDEDKGMARYSLHDDKAGKKVWIWGLSDQGMIWEKLLTDADGQYVEVQSGRLFNQNAEGSSYTPFKHIAFKPYASDSWKEYWYPVNGIQGFVKANEHGAFNIKYEDGWLKLYYFPVQSLHDSLIVKEGEKIIYKKALKLSPEQVFKDSLQIVVNKDKITAVIGIDKLQFNADTTTDTLNRPIETPKNFNWNNAYGLYLLGTELSDQKLYGKAEEKLTASLKQDSNFLPALVQLSALLYRNMRYKEALKLTTRALSINAVDANANYYYGLINEQLGNTTDAKDGFDIAALDPAYRSAAYTELASIYHKEKADDKAMHYIQTGLVYNTHNIAALQLQAVLYRKQNNSDDAQKILASIHQLDPLNHFVLFERYLLNPSEKSKQEYLKSINSELPLESHAELAIWYYKQGCTDEAAQLFTLSLPSPESMYWLAYIHGEKVEVDRMNPSFYFPFRSETASIIEQLSLKQNDWLLKYHLALIYHDRNRITECKQLLLSCGNEPPFAPFYAVRAAIESDSNKMGAEEDLQKALSLSKNWRYYKLLTEHYLSTAHNDKALATITPYVKAHIDDYVMGFLYAKTLLYNNKLAEADKLITNLNILPFEGATESHDVYREVKLKEAINALNKLNYKSSLAYVEAAKLYPENLGVGRPFEKDIDYRLEDWLMYVNYIGMNNKAAADNMLNKVISFSTAAGNTRSIRSSNALITIWAYRKLNKYKEGRLWLDKQIQLHPEEPELSWVRNVLNDSVNYQGITLNSNLRILQLLLTRP